MKKIKLVIVGVLLISLVACNSVGKQYDIESSKLSEEELYKRMIDAGYTLDVETDVPRIEIQKNIKIKKNGSDVAFIFETNSERTTVESVTVVNLTQYEYELYFNKDAIRLMELGIGSNYKKCTYLINGDYEKAKQDYSLEEQCKGKAASEAEEIYKDKILKTLAEIGIKEGDLERLGNYLLLTREKDVDLFINQNIKSAFSRLNYKQEVKIDENHTGNITISFGRGARIVVMELTYDQGNLVKVYLDDSTSSVPFSGSVEIKEGQKELLDDDIISELYLRWIYDFSTEFSTIEDYDIVYFLKNMVNFEQ